jgi:ATP-dependent Clp protease ATP-binding subunit ClpA
MVKIVNKFIDEINELMSDRSIRLCLSSSAIDLLIEKGFDRRMGARPLSRIINDLIKVPISKKILFEQVRNGTVINVNRNNDSLTFDYIEISIYPAIENNSGKVDDYGYITVV